MIIQVLKCDDCGFRIDVDPCDTPEITVQYSEWIENPENGYEHFCPECAKKIKDKNENDQQIES